MGSIPDPGEDTVIRQDSQFEPAYLCLDRGQLLDRIRQAAASLSACRLCPRACGGDRAESAAGVCRTGGRALVGSCFPHFGEERPLTGRRGSGTIFFAWCNLRCVFCQNWDLSHEGAGQPVTPRMLAAMMLELQAAGCHNINLVTPAHVVAQILEAMPPAIDGGLRLPIVYNTSGYDALEALRLLDGIVDIYMPDFKVWDVGAARRMALPEDYPDVARVAVREMHRQVGDLTLDGDGIALRGLLVRHLVMPNGLAGTAEVCRFLASEISPDTYINVMPQYRPAGRAGEFPEIDRPITHNEFSDALAAARAAGLWRFDDRRL